VRFADGTLAARIRVRAFDRDLRTEQPLGEVETDATGSYQIRYGERQFLLNRAGRREPVEALERVHQCLRRLAVAAVTAIGVKPLRQRLPLGVIQSLREKLLQRVVEVDNGGMPRAERQQKRDLLHGWLLRFLLLPRCWSA
jgi:hypothetical protein